MLVVGLTGSPACGKSSVADLLRKQGAHTLDADKVVHALLKKGTEESRRIAREFGKGILNGSGQIDRSRLRAQALSSSRKLAFLESVLHPGVRRAIYAEIAHSDRRQGVLVVEVPLLFETKMDRGMNLTIAVTAPLVARRVFAQARGSNWGDVKKFAARQWSQARKAAHADIVIQNDATRRAMASQVKKVWNRLLQEGSGRSKKKNR